MGLLAALRRCICRTRLGFIFTLVVLSACALLVISYLNSPSDGHQEAPSDGGFGGNHHRGRHHRKGKHHRNHEANKHQQTCRIIKLDYFKDDKDIESPHYPPIHCTGKALFHPHDSVMKLNTEPLHGRELDKCVFRAIGLTNDTHHVYSKPHVTQSGYEIKIKHDFIRAQCYLKHHSSARRYLGRTGEVEGHQIRKLLEDGVIGDKQSENGPEKDDENEVYKGPSHYGSIGIPDPPQIMKVSSKRIKKEKGLSQPSKDTVIDSVREKLIEEQHKAKSNLKDSKPDKKEEKPKSADDGNQLEEVDLGIDILGKDDEPRQPHHQWENVLNPELGQPDFDQFIAQINRKKEVDDRVADITKPESSMQMNVLIFGIDSMSHVGFHRHFPLTYNVLHQNLHAVIMNGYSIVGDGNTGALLPMFTGKFEKELPNTRKNRAGSTFVDSYPLIFYDFDQAGYVTLFAEDQPHFGTFNKRLNGFEGVPVDHYMRPFWLAADKSEVARRSDKYCLGEKPKHNYIMNYVVEFFEKYKDIPKFSFAFLGELSRKHSKLAGQIDKDLVNMLQTLKTSGALENTLVIVMGDHGPSHQRVKRTVKGKLEERLPIMALAYPESFRKKYEIYYKNLKTNADRLTTPFDIYETLHDMLDSERIKAVPKYNARQISLFKEVPMNRTCASAGIDIHWCTCVMYEEIPRDNSQVEKAAAQLMTHINQLIAPVKSVCAQLSLKTIVDAKLLHPREQLHNVKDIKEGDGVLAHTISSQEDIPNKYYQVTIQTSPNEAVYEGTVKHDTYYNTFTVSEDISRLDTTEQHLNCMDEKNPDLARFCHCGANKFGGKDEM